MSAKRRDEINKRLLWLSEQHGGHLTADIIIEDAKGEDSPLHDEFEWNDERAAYSHRVQTANALLNGWTVNVTVENRTLKAPVFVRHPEQRKKFVRVDRMADERELASATLRAEGNRVKAAIGRMSAVAAALGLEERIEALDASLASVLQAVQ